MPTFEIPDGPTSIDVRRPSDPKSTEKAVGSAVYNVTNKSGETRDGRLGVQIAGASKTDWFEIDGERERPFGAGETQTATVKVSIPNDVAAGEYPFRLLVVAVNDPDNDHAQGPVTMARLGTGGSPGGGIPWWVWLIVGLVVLAALGVGGYFLFSGNGEEEEQETNQVVGESTVPKFLELRVDTIAADAGGYQIIKNETPNTGRPPRIVYDQEPDENAPLAAGQRVIVSYEPGVLVPDLPANATFSSAPKILSSAGLALGGFLCDPSSGRPGAQVGTVTDFVPQPRTLVALGSKVEVRAVQGKRCDSKYIRKEDVSRYVNARSGEYNRTRTGRTR